MANGHIWLTRPQEDSEQLAAQLLHHGITSIIAPVMRIEHLPLPAMLPARPEAILITSRHAAPMLGLLPENWRDIPVFCVGAATGTAAHDARFAKINHGMTDILDLLPAMAKQLSAGARVLYLAGAETRVDVVALLAVKEIHVETVIAYEALAETTVLPELNAALETGTLQGVVFFSPRSAQVAAGLLAGRSVAKVEAYCLSLAIAETAGSLAWKGIHACHAPTLEAMVNLVVSRCDSNVV